MGLLVDRVIASYFATNCWIIAPNAGEQCLVIDPGIELPSMVASLRKKLAEHRLSIGAILITHGHLDHTFSLISATKDFIGIDCYVHEMDRDLLTVPERAMGTQSQALVAELKSAAVITDGFKEPESTYSINDGEKLTLGEMTAVIHHAPGHTPGSVVVEIDDEILISGDVLFKGSIGRTDLPRGSLSDMERSLREKIAPLSEQLVVLPGHGDQTVLGHELRTNSYLKAAQEGRLGSY